MAAPRPRTTRRALDLRQPGDGSLEQSQDAGAARRLRRASPLLERKEITQQGDAARQQKEIHRRATPAARARLGGAIDIRRGKGRFFPSRAVDAAATASVINSGGVSLGVAACATI